MPGAESTIVLLFSTRSDERLLTDFLERSPYRVRCPTGGTTLEELLEGVDLIVADERSARRWGRELLARKSAEKIFLPLLVGLSSGRDATPWLAAGFDDVLRLPISRRELGARLSAFLRLRAHALALERRREATLREAQERWHFLSEAGIDGITIHEGGRIVDVNEAGLRILGYTRQELIGMPLERICHPDSLPTILERVRSGSEEPYEVIGVRKDGTTFPCELRPRNLRYGGKMARLVVVRDLTAYKAVAERVRELHAANRRYAEAMRRLEQANADLTTFAQAISHDLKAPLRAVLGFSEIIAERHRDRLDEEGRRYLGHILTGARNMERLIDDLLRYARLGRRGVKRVPVSLATLFAEVRRTFAERIEAAGGTIEIPAGLPVISTDPTLLRQILVNLIENALAYRRREVALRLEIGYKREGGEIRLSLSDNGLGIPPEFREKVFELFHRLHNASEVPGTGIGLALVKRGVELLGGRVWFDSTPDVGTTFHVALPALDGEKDSLMGRLR